MDQQASTVSAIIRALDGKEALVEVEAGGCGRCHEKGGCGGQQLAQMFCASPKTYRVSNNLGLDIGDRVTLAIAAGSVRRTANLAYGVPLTATIIGAALGTLLAGDFGGIFGAAVSFALSLFYVRMRSHDASGKFLERPYIVSIP